MLVLTRRTSEPVYITHAPSGDRIKVIVSRIEVGKVRLGFDGPEVFQISREQNRQATTESKAITEHA